MGGLRNKLGLNAKPDFDEEDNSLANDWLELLKTNEVDYTLAFRSLADAAEANPATLERLFPSPDDVQPWLSRWRSRLTQQPASQVANHLRAVNPVYIPRNHLLEEALDAASEQDNLKPFERLLQVLAQPFEEQPDCEHYARPASREFTACYRTFCGT